MNDENNDLRGPENNLEGPQATDTTQAVDTGPGDLAAAAAPQPDAGADPRVEILLARLRHLQDRNEELENQLERRDDLPVAATTGTASGSGGPTGTSVPADPRTGGESYVVNEGGDPLTYRVVDVDDDGNATGFRIARVIVRNGTLALSELEPQAPAQMNAAEIDALERRIADLRRGRG